MKAFIATILAVVLCFTGLTTQAQSTYSPDRKFGTDALQEDLTILRTVLEKAHIGLYRYATKKTMDSLFSQCADQVKQPLTELEFFKLITPILVTIRDEHTFALPSQNYWNTEIGQTVYSASSSKSTTNLFPFFIKVMGNRLLIDNNLSQDTTLQRGDEILTINEQPVSAILNRLLPTIPTNGFIETFRYRHLEQFSMNQTYNRFMVHYAFFIDKPNQFRLSIKSGSKPIQQLTVAALTSSQLFNNYWRRYSTLNDAKKKNENPLELTFLSTKTAYLRLSSFHPPIWSRYNYSFSTEYKVFFEAIRHNPIENLIIDLRANEGGNPAIGMALLPYILTRPFRPYEYHEVKDYKFDSLKTYFRDSTALPHYVDELFTATDHQTFRTNPEYKSETWSRPMEPSPLAYGKKLYVLVNGATGSAASILATVIRVNRPDAVFIGEECGGDMEGPISGGGTDITLPHTQIRVDIPYIKRVINLKGYPHQAGRGIQPDHRIEPSVADLVRNEDTELRFTLKLIDGK
jgi:hypothetical protein